MLRVASFCVLMSNGFADLQPGRFLGEVKAVTPEAPDFHSGPIQRLVFIKTHATGSSTLTSIFHTYCDVHGVRCFVHPKHMSPMLTVYEKGLMNIVDQLRETHTSIDVWPNHAIFYPEMFDQIVPNGFKVSIFRDPLSRVVSSWGHSSTDTIMEEVLRLTDNRTSAHPGGLCGQEGLLSSEHVPLSSFHALNMTLLNEHYDMSLMLLRRRLRWSMVDMVYFRKKRSVSAGDLKKEEALDSLRKLLSMPKEDMNSAVRAVSKACLEGDEQLLYEHAQQSFAKELSSLTLMAREEIQNETLQFQQLLVQVSRCCQKYPSDPYCRVLQADNIEWVEQRRTTPIPETSLPNARCRIVAEALSP